MKKTLITIALWAAAALALTAQEAESTKPFSISIQGGALFSVNENSFSYLDNGKAFQLITPQGGVSFGYDFRHRFGVRLDVSYGKNAGACNTVQTSTQGFYPYTFNSLNIFADAVLNLGAKASPFSPKLYLGIGGAHTFGFSATDHPWQTVSGSNTAFGFRGGFIAQYDFTSRFGIFADLRAEAYSDNYNGLRPNSEDQDKATGYAGFPMDLRGIASLGVVYHF